MSSSSFAGTLSREQAAAASRSALSARLGQDSPGPGALLLQHTALDKHVPRTLIGGAPPPARPKPPCDRSDGSCRRSDQRCTTQQPEQQQPEQQQPGQQQQQRGTSSFLAVSREQCAAAASRGAVAPCCGSSALLAAPDVSGRGAPSFAKQIRRPFSAAAGSSCPAALGPSAYFRTQLPPSRLTGAALAAAGHALGAAAGAPTHGRGSGRPCTSQARMAAAGRLTAAHDARDWAWASSVLAGSAAGEALLGHPCSCLGMDVGAVPAAGGRGSGSASRPASAALRYARAQAYPTALLPADADPEPDSAAAGRSGSSNFEARLPWAAAAAGSPAPPWWWQRQQRPASAAVQDKQHAQQPHASLRPATAAPHLGRRPCTAIKPFDAPHASKVGSSSSQGLQQQAAHSQESPHWQDLRCSSAGLLGARVKGGRFSQSARQPLHTVVPAGAAARSSAVLLAAATQPRPEVLGHMQRAPSWSLPPNRVADSRKWAEAAAWAALQ